MGSQSKTPNGYQVWPFTCHSCLLKDRANLLHDGFLHLFLSNALQLPRCRFHGGLCHLPIISTGFKSLPCVLFYGSAVIASVPPGWGCVGSRALGVGGTGRIERRGGFVCGVKPSSGGFVTLRECGAGKMAEPWVQERALLPCFILTISQEHLSLDTQWQPRAGGIANSQLAGSASGFSRASFMLIA